jgi:Catalase
MAIRVPSQEWKETPLENEEEQFARIVQRIVNRVNEKAERAKDKPRRGFHAKIHAGVMGEFKVLPDVPEAAKFGVFAKPAVYPTFVRFSNGQSDLQPDTKPQPRGIALKLVGVSGGPDDRLNEAKHAATQDFLATSHSLTSIVRDVLEFFAVLEVTEGDGGASLLSRISTAVRHPLEAARLAARLTKDVILPRVDSMATEYYSSTAPIQCGKFAMKFLIHPPPDVAAARHESGDNYLRRELAARLGSGDVHFDFSVQFFVDSEHTPIEDTSVEWADDISPMHKVAELRIPKCDIESPQGMELTEIVDQLSFFPWHGLKAHQPLGNVMRARRLAYPKSAEIRTFLAEPTRADDGASLAEGGTAESLRASIRVASS